MTFRKPTVNERLALALQVANSNNMGLAVRLAKLEAVMTALCEHCGVEVEFDESEVKAAAEKMIEEVMAERNVQNMPEES